MAVIHFENGKRVDIQRVDASAKIEEIKRNTVSAASWTKIYTVPTGEKWNIVQLGANRDNAENIAIYITDPGSGQIKLVDSEAAVHILTYDINFSITGGWILTFVFTAGVVGLLKTFIMCSVEDEY